MIKIDFYHQPSLLTVPGFLCLTFVVLWLYVENHFMQKLGACSPLLDFSLPTAGALVSRHNHHVPLDHDCPARDEDPV